MKNDRPYACLQPACCYLLILVLVPALSYAGWVSQNSGTNAGLFSVHFPMNILTGYAVGDNGTILKTTDGGTNWVIQSSDTTYWLQSVHFPVDAQNGFAVGGGLSLRPLTEGPTG